MLKSLKNKLKQAKKEAATLPREMKEIQAEHDQLVTKAGTTQYAVHAYNEELKRLNKALESVNYEAAARQKMDAEAKKTEATKEGA